MNAETLEPDEYCTLKGPSEGLYKEKGSRFIACAMPVDSTEGARQQLEALRKKYHDARHHCYAYRIGQEPGETRYNDDGEPSGTAGKPIFGQIQAYKTAARDAIGNGVIVTRTWTDHLLIQFPYGLMNDVMRLIKEEGLQPAGQEFGSECRISLEIRKGKTAAFTKKLTSFENVVCHVI